MKNELVDQKSNVIDIYKSAGNALQTAENMGKVFMNSGLFGVTTEAQGSVIALECITKGYTPMDVIRRFHVIKGKLTERSDYMLAEFRKRGGKVIWKQFDGVEARAQFIFDGNDIEAHFSFEEAKEAGYCYGSGNNLKDNWKTSRPDMLRARLISKTVRFLCPEVISGFYTPEEASDFTKENIEIPKLQDGSFLDEKEEIKVDTKQKEDPFEEAEIVEEKTEKQDETLVKPTKEVSPEEGEKESKPSEFDGHEFKAVLDAMKENEEKANKFLSVKKWIQEGETFVNTPDEKLKRISGNVPGFVEVLTNFKG